VLLPFKILAVIALAILSVFAAIYDSTWMALFFIALIVLLLSGHCIDYWILKRRFRKSPYRNEHITITISDGGFHAIGGKSETKLTWEAFTKAAQFRDGFLLFQGPTLFNWLPVSGIVSGTPVEIDQLIRKHIKEHKIASSSRTGTESSTAARGPGCSATWGKQKGIKEW
jgi:hypothetical protein